MPGQENGATNLPAHRKKCAGILLLLLLLAAWLSGCASVGRDFPTDAIENIRIGETSRSQIREMFGAPWRVGIEDGREVWTYGKYRYRLFGEASTTDLVIRFDKKGTVTSYTYNTTENPKTTRKD
jgi:outer membrane protein assembly factor BamE (lipoprotein component of BamABCDE complex)